MNEYFTPAVVKADPKANITDLLEDRLKQTPDGALFAIPTADGGWNDVTTREFHAQVVALAKGFIAAGIKPGEKIGFMCKTRYEWTLIDFAAWYAGAVLVPIYETSAPSQIQYILTDSGATAIILETAEHFTRFDEIASEVPQVTKVWQMSNNDIDKLVKDGAKTSDADVEKRRSAAVGKDLATLIYTSGSTGVPKGCILSHSNFVETCRNAAVAMSEVVNPKSTTLLFITTAHVFARFISVLSVARRREGRPPGRHQAAAAVARQLQAHLPPGRAARVREGLQLGRAEGGGRRQGQDLPPGRRCRGRALEGARRRPRAARPQAAVRAVRPARPEQAKAAMGGNVRYAVSGSAPLSTRLGHFFRSMNVMILEGYGLTETTAPATVNLTTRFKIGTTGPALPGVGLKIAEDGEIWVKGVDVFGGYWNKPKETAETFEGEWFKTGDIGALDDEGYLTITGRKKEILVTAGGKNVAPAALEDPIRANPIVGQVVVCGDQKPFIAALITLDSEMLPVWLNNNGEAGDMSLDEAVKNPKVLAEVQKAVDAANARVSRAESIRKFVILPTEFTEASGHLTPKMSIKRGPIMKDFSGQIEGMYADAPTQGQSLVH